MKMTCISCPIGCRMEVLVEDGKVTSVKGNACPRGLKYANQEAVSPQRIVTAVVQVSGSEMPLSVKTQDTIPKAKIFECMRAIHDLELTAPIKIGTVVIENVCDSGVNVIATKNID